MSRLLILLIGLIAIEISAQNEIVDSLMNEISKTSDQVKIADMWLDIAEEQLEFSLDESLNSAKKTLSISEEIGNRVNKGRALSWIGRIYGEQSKYDSAEMFLNQAIEIFSDPIDSFYLTKTYNALGIIYRYTDQFNKAIDYQFKAAKMAEDQGQFQVAASSYNSIGNIYTGMDDYETALTYYERAVTLLDPEKNSRSLAGLYLNMANLIDSNLDKKLDYYKQSIAIAEKYNYPRILGYVYTGMANYHEEVTENIDSQKYYYSQALEKATSVGDAYISAYAKLYGGMLESKDNPDKSITLLREALDDEYIQSVFELRAEGNYHLAHALAAKGNYKRAFEALDTSLTYYEKRYDEELLDAAAEANSKFESELKEAEIIKQQLEIERQERDRNQILGGSAILLLLSGGIGLWYYQRQSSKKKIAELALENEILERKKLEELDDLKTQFFTNVSHELKTPLTLILGPLSNTIEKTTDRSSKESLLLAYNNAERLNDLINETLDLAKIEKGKMELNKEARPIARDLIRGFLSFSSLAEMRDIQLEGHIHFSEDKFISCDIDKIEKILNNLVSNAIKFSPNGSKVMMNATMDDQLTVNITDYGRGIPIDEQPLIFNRFYQAKHNQYGSYGGTGIGLAFSKEISELLGGDLSVQSEEGKGSTFTLTLPVEYTDAPEITEEETWDKQSEEDSHYQPLLINGEKPKVLIVEDNKEMQGYLKSLLEETYHCDFAIDGYEAIKKVQSQRYHLISSDVMMPNMDGFTLKQRINSLPDYRKIPFIFLTARSLEEDKISGLQLGVDDYITKPFNKNEYQIRIYNLLQNHKERMMADQEFSKTEVTETVDNKILKDAETIILENIENPAFKVTDLADQLHYSQRQLARIIKQLTGLTPVNFILELRLQKAYTMIKSRAFRSVSEVRYSVGIESASYFTRKFKERFGVSPSEL